jgi:hypothetical protein
VGSLGSMFQQLHQFPYHSFYELYGSLPWGLLTVGVWAFGMAIKTGEDNYFVAGLISEPIPPLLRIEPHIARFASILRSNLICFQNILGVDGLGIENCKWHISDFFTEWTPNAMNDQKIILSQSPDSSTSEQGVQRSKYLLDNSPAPLFTRVRSNLVLGQMVLDSELSSLPCMIYQSCEIHNSLQIRSS